jgi:hypothetical protein
MLGLTFLLLAALSSLTVAQQCYFPDGSLSTKDIACDPTGVLTKACCGLDAICTQNHLCFVGGSLSRGSCTDQSWKDSNCTGAPQCTENTRSGGTDVLRCGYQPNGPFACDFARNCQDERSTFPLYGPWGILIRPDQAPGVSATRAIVLDPISGLEDLPAPTDCTATVTTTPPVRFSTVSYFCPRRSKFVLMNPSGDHEWSH